ncbi:MAG: LPS assembly protein LptD, partial [Proteobacteria bacterium]|nr:LPS assembly protein LptD [Pseudomonadota bacterium]
GQSYQIRQDRDTFPRNAGLDEKFSDIVTRAQISPSSYFNLLARARFDKETLALQSNEIISTIGPPALRLSANYGQYERQTLGALGSREELLLSLGARLSRYWSTSASSITDLTEGAGTRALGMGLKYEDECFLVTTTVSRSFYHDRDLRPSDTILIRVFFKTLGDFTAQVF